MERPLFVRNERNPLITPRDIPFDVNAVLNPGVALVDGKPLLLLRIEDARGISGIHVARSPNGVDNWKVAPLPLLEPGLPDYPFEKWGCEDPRVTQIGPSRWVIAYTAYSPFGPTVALAITDDFQSVTRLGVALSPSNKDATVFPRKIGDLWLMLHRPVTGGGEHIWYVCSPDLEHQARPGLVMPTEGGPWWDGRKIGVGAPPIDTDSGWLMIYHGVKEAGARLIYRLGIALLDRDNPRLLIARAARWAFAPEADYEQSGLLPGVVYTCGALDLDGEIWMYYGAADTVIGLATAKRQDQVKFALEHDYTRRQLGYQLNIRQELADEHLAEPGEKPPGA